MTDAMRLSICVAVGLISCFLALSFGAANTPLSDVFNGLFRQAIIFAIFSFNNSSKVPGVDALIPIVGTILILLYGNNLLYFL